MSKRITRSSKNAQLTTPISNKNKKKEEKENENDKKQKCKHSSTFLLEKIKKEILNPINWSCNNCGTTEGVWACLKCGSMGCGEFQQGHSSEHFKKTGHSLAFEVNMKSCYCYACEQYVTQDNSRGDLKSLKSLLEDTQTHTISQSTTRSGRVLKPLQRIETNIEDFREFDRMNTAENHWKLTLLKKIFDGWRTVVNNKKENGESDSEEEKDGKEENKNSKGKTSKNEPEKIVASSSNEKTTKITRSGTTLITSGSTSSNSNSAPVPTIRGRVLVPGITGLRNLGNTCFMNTVLQALSNLTVFRDFFVSQILGTAPKDGESIPSIEVGGKLYTRQATLECMRALRGTGSMNKLTVPLDEISLSMQVHALLRVIWSGKWAVVTPFSLLQALWKYLPERFRSYQQQDAQEFLSCLLDRIHTELGTSVIDTTFQGRLLSEVICSVCGYRSKRIDPFLDLSIDIPLISLAKPPKKRKGKSKAKKSDEDDEEGEEEKEGGEEEEKKGKKTAKKGKGKGKAKAKGKAKSTAKKGKAKSKKNEEEEEEKEEKEKEEEEEEEKEDEGPPIPVCTLEECLDGFVTPEVLNGEIWYCEKCKCKRDASKKMSIAVLPPVLCIVLKRFFWTATARAKIDTRVTPPFVLDVKPYTATSGGLDLANSVSFSNIGIPSLYDLRSIVMHHGTGLGCGHYTAFAYNENHKIWVHYNDSRVRQVDEDDIKLDAPAGVYIMFYQRREINFEQEDSEMDTFTPLLPPQINQSLSSSSSNNNNNNNNNNNTSTTITTLSSPPTSKRQKVTEESRPS